MALAAEARTGLRFWWRTTLLRERLVQQADTLQAARDKLQRREQAWRAAQTWLEETQQQLGRWQAEAVRLQGAYQAQECPERSYSRLAQARRRFTVQQRRLPRRQKAMVQAQGRVEKQCQRLQTLRTEQTSLLQRSARFEADNATNSVPIQVLFRLDAGFGTGEDVALLIEMGYQVYTKLYSHRVSAALPRGVNTDTHWEGVGANAETSSLAQSNDGGLAGCPTKVSSLSGGCGLVERFHTGSELRHSALLHYGHDPVTQDLAAWFQCYNGRQTIEAGIKEGQQVFQMHHLKVRSEAGLLIQEHFAAFAANFVRWAAHWLAEQCPHVDGAFAITSISVKQLVQIGANTSAWVIWQPGGCLVRFTEYSAFTGTTLRVQDTGLSSCHYLCTEVADSPRSEWLEL